MQIVIRGKNISVTDALKDYVQKKLGKIEKFFDTENIEAQVALSVEKDRHIVEVTVLVDGILLRGEEDSADMYASIDQVLDKLEKQIEKHKTKIYRTLRKSARANAKNQVLDEDGQDEPRVVRTKRFALKPMAVEEAILQMNLLGHTFFVFRNADTEEINVLYKRKDGNYGLIEPDV